MVKARDEWILASCHLQEMALWRQPEILSFWLFLSLKQGMLERREGERREGERRRRRGFLHPLEEQLCWLGTVLLPRNVKIPREEDPT